MGIDILFVMVAAAQFAISLFAWYFMGKIAVKFIKCGYYSCLDIIVSICAFFAPLISVLFTHQILGNKALGFTYSGLIIGYWIGALCSDCSGENEDGVRERVRWCR